MKKSLVLALLFLFASLVKAQDRQLSQLNNVAAIESSTHWQPVKPPGNTGMNMTIIGIVQFDGEEQFSDQLEVGAFHDNVCRGAGLTNVVALNRYFVFLTVYGLNGEEDTFKIYDHATGEELDMATTQTITYVDNVTLGTLPAPYIINYIPNYFEITIASDPIEGGTTTGAGIYNPGNTATLTATPNVGYSFVNWTKDNVQVSTSPEYSFTVNENASYVAHFSLNSYQISASANPTAGGTVTGGNTYDYGSTCTLTATANTGYTFVNWTKDGNQVSTNATYSFTVIEAGSYVANFTLNNYNISASPNPTEGGSVSGGGTYPHGNTVTLTATPNQYYYFTNWTKAGTEVSTSATYSFTATENGDYVANFGINNYHISVMASPMQGGTVTGAGNYNNGTSVTLTATPKSGYDFVNWTKNGEEVSTSTSFSIVVTENASYVAHFSANTFEITATADPAEYGTVTGAGSFGYGATARLKAIPNTGYSFVNWTRGGEVVSTSASYNFTVTESVDLVAHFAISTYNITASASPYQGGSVSGGGTYQHGATVTLTATPKPEYDFVNWTKGVTEVSTDATYSFTATENGNYVAHFNLQTYTITAMADPSQGGTVNGAGTYNRGATCTLTATASTGYTFVNWTKDDVVVSTSGTISFQVNEDASYVAHFSLNSYEIIVSANPTIGGMASGGGTYYHGTTVTLTASPSAGYHFINWTKNGVSVSTNANYSFIAEGAGNYVANFLPFYDIAASVDPEGAGSVSGMGTYNQGTTCTLVATATTGYTFTNWTYNDTIVSTSPTYSFTVAQAKSFVAHFEVSNYLITVKANPTAGGIVTGGGTYTHGATATLTAVANEGYTFVGWRRNGVVVSTEPTYIVSVTGAATYVAQFSLNSYEVSVVCDPANAGAVTGAGTYYHGSTCTLSVTANEGYTFVNWTKGGEEVGTSTTISFVVTEAVAYVANFQLNSYEITATANLEVGGTVTGAGTYNHFETCTLTATANEGYTFINWTRDGAVVSTSASYSFTVTESAAYVANFSLNSYQVTATANPTAGGTVTGAGTYNHFETCTLTATANEGYTFVNWTSNDTVVSTSSTCSFTVTGAATYVAHFQINSYEIAAEANPAVGGVITGAGTYNHFETCTLTAIENEGYTFISWTRDGEEVSTTPTYSFTVTESASFVANFQLNSYGITATANPEAGGTVTGGGTYNHFETCTLTATPAEDFIFINWSKNGTVVSTSANYSFPVVEGGDYVANFVPNEYQINVSANPSNGGVVTGGGVYNYLATATLTATANTGFSFVNWTKNGAQVSIDTIYTFIVTETADYIGNFELNQYQINASADPMDGGSVTGSGTYNHGEIVTLTATPSNGYHFVNWTKDGNQVSTDPIHTFTATETADFVAHFEYTIVTYEVTTESDPIAGGTTTGDGTYNQGDYCTVTATANDGYTFVNWTKNGNEVSTNVVFQFVVDEDTHLVAHFQLNSYQIAAFVDPQESGIINGAGTYFYGQTATLTVIPNEHYVFQNWTEDGAVVSEAESYSFEVTRDRNLVAHLIYFEGIDENYNVDISIYPNPTSYKVTVEASQVVNRWEIITVSGLLVYSSEDNTDKMEFWVNQLVPGTYLIRMTINNAVLIRKFVKK